MTRLLLPFVVVPLALLGACQSRDAASVSALRYASLDAAFEARNRPAPRLDRGAVAAFPDWFGRPSAIRVIERPEGIAQTITFDRAGGSGRLVAAWPEDGAGASDLPLKPTRDGIQAEMAAVLPGLAMEVVTRPAHNAYGPYGLAIGRSGGGPRCLYAWQWIEAPPALGFAESGRPLSLRLRLCRSDLTFEAMAAAFDRLRLVPGGGPLTRNDIVAARPRPPRPRPVAAIRPAPDLVSAAAPDASGRRYLGADAEPAPRPAAPASLAAALPAAPVPTGRIDLDLPPEALRGPATDSSRPRP